MYSPYLYARSTELLCLRDLVAKGVSLNGLLPILEPINVNTRNLLTCLNVWNSDIIVILNPYQEDFSSHNNVLTLNQNLSSVLTNKNNIISGYLIQPNTTINDINNWLNANLNRRVALLYDNPSLSNSDIQLLATNQLISYHVVLNNKMLPNQCALLPLSKLIIISDNFRKLAKNADYNGPELFTHAHQFVGQNYLGFGDYTITGGTRSWRWSTFCCCRTFGVQEFTSEYSLDSSFCIKQHATRKFKCYCKIFRCFRSNYKSCSPTSNPVWQQHWS